jgi:hypothetical protein
MGDSNLGRPARKRAELRPDALDAFLRRRPPKLGDAFRRALAEAPEGFGIEREQPAATEKRAWKR